MNWKRLSDGAQAWIRDCRDSDEDFPVVDLEHMNARERDRLAEYLESDDGSLSAADMQFSRDVAGEVQALTAEGTVEDE
jgi:hypothetical protein